MRRLLALALLVALPGCAVIDSRKALLAPQALHTPEFKASMVAAYSGSLLTAQAKPSRANILEMIDSGNAVNTMNCSDWLGRISASKRDFVLSDKNFAVAQGLTTTLMGLAEVASTSVAVVGALGTALSGFSTNVQTDLLTAPSPYQVQTVIFGALWSCSAQLHDDAPFINFGQAVMRLEACSKICSFDFAQAATNAALNSTSTTVSPVSGDVRTVPKKP